MEIYFLIYDTLFRYILGPIFPDELIQVCRVNSLSCLVCVPLLCVTIYGKYHFSSLRWEKIDSRLKTLSPALPRESFGFSNFLFISTSRQENLLDLFTLK